MDSIETKLMETYYQVSTKHTFKKLSVDAGFQKAKRFLQDGSPLQNSKKARQALLQLEQSNSACLSIQQILIL